jgi:hypothetical protein
MWRPFAGNFVGHSYENFTRKHKRVETAPADPKRETSDYYDLKNIKNDKSFSKEAQQRLDEFIMLKQKVRFQRKKMKERDTNIEMHKDFKIRILKNFQNFEKEKKNQETLRIRNFSDNKAKKHKSLSLKPIKKTEENDPPIFILTSPIKLNTSKKLKFKTIPNHKLHKKNIISVRDYQDKVMKELKSKVPTYYKELKAEFMKIREYSEMTFDQFQESKRLRWSSPYKIRTKSKSSR